MCTLGRRRQVGNNANDLCWITSPVIDRGEICGRTIFAEDRQPRGRRENRQMGVAIVVAGDDVMLKSSGANEFRYDRVDVSWGKVLEDIGGADHITIRNGARDDIHACDTNVVRQVGQFR